MPVPHDQPAAPRALALWRRIALSAVALVVAVRAWCYARLEEIRFRTGLAVLTGLVAVTGGAIAAVVLTGRGGTARPVPRALPTSQVLMRSPASVAYPLRPVHGTARVALARPGRHAGQARALTAGANASGQMSGAPGPARPAHPQWPGRGQWWRHHGWPPPGGDEHGQGNGHGWGQTDGQGYGWGQTDGWGRGQGGDD